MGLLLPEKIFLVNHIFWLTATTGLWHSTGGGRNQMSKFTDTPLHKLGRLQAALDRCQELAAANSTEPLLLHISYAQQLANDLGAAISRQETERLRHDLDMSIRLADGLGFASDWEKGGAA